MAKGIFIIGTDTGVGKTVFSAGLMYLLLKNKFNAGYYKPIASGEIVMGDRSVPADAWFVKIASGYREEEEDITPFSFKNAVSPHLASRLENRPIDFGIVQEKLTRLSGKYDRLLVEGCGGLAVPLNDQGYLLCDLIRDTGLNCFLVSRAGLGAINHTLLTLEYAGKRGIQIKGIFMNGYAGSIVEKDNLETLKRLTGHPAIFPVPELQGVDVEALKTGNLRTAFENEIDIGLVVNLMGDLKPGEAVG
jgi:dethiobiotin synthetase